jgi:polar amino acid transport system substrate-binding protein
MNSKHLYGVLVFVLIVLGGVICFGFGGSAMLGAFVWWKKAPAEKGAAPTPLASLSEIQSRGHLRIAADIEAPPFLEKTGEGQYQGFEYALMRTLADRARVPLEIVPVGYDELVPAVVSGKADLAIGQLARVEGQPVDWSVSYLQYSLCLVVLKPQKPASLAELGGKKIGHYNDPAVIQTASQLIGRYQPVLFSDYGYFEQLSEGKLDAVLYDCPLARYELAPFSEKLWIALDSLNVFSYSVAVPAGQKKLFEEVNQLIIELGQQGLLEQLKSRWLGESAQSNSEKFITVQLGESLEDVAVRVLGSVEKADAIYTANTDILGDDRKTLYSGMRLRVP